MNKCYLKGFDNRQSLENWETEGYPNFNFEPRCFQVHLITALKQGICTVSEDAKDTHLKLLMHAGLNKSMLCVSSLSKECVINISERAKNIKLKLSRIDELNAELSWKH